MMHQPCSATNAYHQQAIIIKDCMSEGSIYTPGMNHCNSCNNNGKKVQFKKIFDYLKLFSFKVRKGGGDNSAERMSIYCTKHYSNQLDMMNHESSM